MRQQQAARVLLILTFRAKLHRTPVTRCGGGAQGGPRGVPDPCQVDRSRRGIDGDWQGESSVSHRSSVGQTTRDHHWQCGIRVQHGSTATEPPASTRTTPRGAAYARTQPHRTGLPIFHTEEVTGSIPVSPTINHRRSRPLFRGAFLILSRAGKVQRQREGIKRATQPVIPMAR